MENKNCNYENLEKRILILEKEVMHLKNALQYQLQKNSKK